MRRVYVVELMDAPKPCDSPRGVWLYVGESSHTPEVRFQQHKTGYKPAKWVRTYGRRLRPDLYSDVPPVRSSYEAEEAEHLLAERLRAQGYCVRTGPPRAES